MNAPAEVDAIKKLDQSWGNIEAAISHIGSVVRNETADASALQRYEGYKAGLIALMDAYINQVHYDRLRPEALPSFGSLTNYTGPSPDFTYKLLHLEPGARYRVWGQRGDAAIVDLQQLAGWYGERTEAVTDKRSSVTLCNKSFDEIGIEFDEKGNFDFTFSPDKCDGQWWKLEDGVNTVLIRDYFTDYTKQNRSSIFYFDKLDGSDQAITPIGIEDSAARLAAVANSVKDFEFTFKMPAVHARDGDNIIREFDFGSDAGAADQRYIQARFNVQPEQALIGKWMAPQDCVYWSIALYNDFYGVLNYANRQVNLNEGNTRVGEDGSLYFVLSHRDPGVANWLDLDGHKNGLILTRTKGKDGRQTKGAVPSLTLVPFDDVLTHLPQDIAMISASERAHDLAVRRRHFHLRENR
jgi:hypothetical protein